MYYRNSLSNNRPQRRRGIAIWSLAMVAVIGVGGMTVSAAVSAQETDGRIFGRAPAGETVLAISTDTGLQRQVDVEPDGHYTFDDMPLGTYTVVLEEGGQPVLQHLNVGVTVDAGIEVDFDCAKYRCVPPSHRS